MSYLVPDPPAERDPEAYCVCGHHETEHANLSHERARWPRRCQSESTPLCTCWGYRRGGRFGHRHRA